jgi:hypothetical protein
MFIGYGRLVFALGLQDVGKLCFLPERHCVMRQVEGGGLFCDTHARHPPTEARSYILHRTMLAWHAGTVSRSS